MFRLPEGRPALMGILNVTPDSFSDGGRFGTHEGALAAGLEMMEAGADLIDVGGESTRPGALPVPEGEEEDRVLPVIEALGRAGIPVSVDTQKPEVARKALDAGAFLINDVGGLREPAMRALVAVRKCAVCIMHMQGSPVSMQANPVYADVVGEVRETLVERAEWAVRAGLPVDHVWIDPGIGFGKTLEHNLSLLGQLDVLVRSGFPVLVGVSRKGFLGAIGGGIPTAERLPGTLAAQVLAQAKGARIIRAHDIREARRAIDVAAAILGSTLP